MNVEVPRFIEILALAKLAHGLAQDEYFEARRVIRDYAGALPKRRHGRRCLIRLEKRALKKQILFPAFLTGPEKSLLVAAYDQGLVDRHAIEEKSGAA